MQLHELKPKTKNKKRMTVGRGGKRGKTSGRGTKGQKARAGHKIRPELRDFIKRLPKMRGRGKNSNKTIQTKPVVVNLSKIEVNFAASETISPTTLVAKGVIELFKGNAPKVKILADGELTKKFFFSGVTVSEAAKAKIEKAGGAVK